MVHDAVWIGRRVIRLVVVVTLVLAACSPPAEDQVRSASCGPQSGMSGDLSTDIVGVWRLSYTGSADGGPSEMLMEFSQDGTATILSARFGSTPWVYRIVGDEVRMNGNWPGVDLQMFSMVWQFAAGMWQVNAVGYGDTTLERCDDSAM